MLYIAIILFALVSAGLIVLTIVNFPNDVSLSLVFWQTPSLPVGLLLLLAFVLGALMLYIVSAASAWEETRELKKLRQQVAELEQRGAANISTGPLPTATPIVPMPGMPPDPDISDMPTQH